MDLFCDTARPQGALVLLFCASQVVQNPDMWMNALGHECEWEEPVPCPKVVNVVVPAPGWKAPTIDSPHLWSLSHT